MGKYIQEQIRTMPIRTCRSCLHPLWTNLRLCQAVVGESTESDDQAGHRRRLAARSLGGRPQISFDIKQVACGVVHPTILPTSLTDSLAPIREGPLHRRARNRDTQRELTLRCFFVPLFLDLVFYFKFLDFMPA